MSTLESELGFYAEKVLWTYRFVEEIEHKNPNGPTEQVHELSLTCYPQWDSGVFIKHVETSLLSEDAEPERELVYIKKEAVPELLAALQKYLSESSNEQENP